MPVTRKLQARGMTDVNRVGVRDGCHRARRTRGAHRVSGGVQGASNRVVDLVPVPSQLEHKRHGF
jgi:hypothetical protein